MVLTFMNKLRMLPLLVVFISAPVFAQAAKVDLKRLVFAQCKANCDAKKAVQKLKPYSHKTALKNPVGSEVCVNQIGGKVGKLSGKDVCVFRDKSSVELIGLHLESEKFLKP